MPSGGQNKIYDYTKELAEEICQAVSVNPYSLKKICRLFPQFPPPYIIYNWFLKHPDFRDNFTRAKDNQVETYVEEMLAEIEDSEKYTYVDKEGNKRVDAGSVNFARLKVDSIKWYAGKLKAKKYGNQIVADVTNEDDKIQVNIQLSKD